MQVANHHICFSALNKSQGNSSFHLGLNFHIVLAFSLFACFCRLRDFDNKPVGVSFVKLENSFRTLGLCDSLDPCSKPKSSRCPLFFNMALLVLDGSLGLDLFFPVSSLNDVFPLSRLLTSFHFPDFPEFRLPGQTSPVDISACFLPLRQSTKVQNDSGKTTHQLCNPSFHLMSTTRRVASERPS